MPSVKEVPTLPPNNTSTEPPSTNAATIKNETKSAEETPRGETATPSTKIDESANTPSTTATSTTAEGSASGNLAAPIYNPISEWQEPIDIPFLTLFDMHRKPRKMISEKDSEIRLPLKILSSEFHCPVCLGYMKKTSIVMECLHRFCGECIQKCLRLGKKECPSCRIHIPSRRSLRPDPNFDNIIQNIYGDIEALEDFEEKKIENLNKAKNMNNAYSESRKRGIMQQAIHRRKKTSSSFPSTIISPSANNPVDRSTSLSEAVEEAIAPSIDFVLRRHPQETLVDCLNREYIRTSSSITIKHIKTFLSRKLEYEPESHFQILTVSGGEGVIIDENVTMSEVQRDICNSSDNNLILHFRVVPDSS